jgi:hypothetical protein
MNQPDSNPGAGSIGAPAQPARFRPKQFLTQGTALLAIVVLGGYMLSLAGVLWEQWSMLQREVRESERTVAVGYVDIMPYTSYARPPASLYRDEGGETLIWSRWENGVGHRWYHLKQGEIDTSRIARQMGFSLSRAIDYPLVENAGGAIWRLIPSEAPVVSDTFEGEKCVYPTDVLDKVQVVNDMVGERPFMIVDNPLAPAREAVAVYDPVVDGHRLTMAVSGYFKDGKPLLVDRGTESFWQEDEGQLLAIAGKYHEKRLARIARLVPVKWSTWQSRNREGRLLVGADRARGIPKE